MGSSVSTDETPLELSELLSDHASTAHKMQGAPGRCVRAWAFRTDAKAEAIALISVTPADLLVDQSYLILSIAEPQNNVEFDDDVHRWAQFVLSVMTPRGLSAPVTVVDHFVSGVQCSIWVWNGTESPCNARQRALLTAINLEKQFKGETSVESLLACATAHVNSCEATDNTSPLQGALARGFRRLLGCVSRTSGYFPSVRRELQALSKVVPAPDSPHQENGPITPRATQENGPITPRATHATQQLPRGVDTDKSATHATQQLPRGVDTDKSATHATQQLPRGVDTDKVGALKVVGLQSLERGRKSPKNNGRGRKRDSDSLDEGKGPPKRSSIGFDLGALSHRSHSSPEEDFNLREKDHRQLLLNQFRPVCSPVIPEQLYLSGYSVASNSQSLRASGITHIVNCAGDVCVNKFEDEIVYMTYYLKDSKEEDIGTVFYRTFDFIDGAVREGGRVLVHCWEGVSRSCTLIQAYIMCKQRIDNNVAFSQIQKVRGIVNPNPGFYCQLLVLRKRLHIDGIDCGEQDNKVTAYRVSPHDARHPFLVLRNFDYARQVEIVPYDSRFGFVLRKATSFLGWIGKNCPNTLEVQSAIEEHVQCVKKYEGAEDVELSIFQEGSEPAQFWEWNQVNCSGPGFVSSRPEFDNDMRILMDVKDCDSFSSSPPCSDSTPATPNNESEPAQLYDTEDLSRSIHRYDSEDLEPQKSYLLLVRSTGLLFLWIGQEACPNTAHKVATEFMDEFDEELELTVLNQGQEPSSFWELYFEDG